MKPLSETYKELGIALITNNANGWVTYYEDSDGEKTLNAIIMGASGTGKSLLDSFYRDVKIFEDGLRVEIKCRLGLWGVSAPTMEQALREAQHYYLQYQMDGEYEELTYNTHCEKTKRNTNRTGDCIQLPY